MAEAATLGLAGRPVALRWAVLVAASVALAALFAALHISAALLLGPLAAAVALAVSEAEVKVPPVAFLAAQAVLGAMIARSFTPSLFAEFARRWPLFVVALASVLLAAGALGWLLCRWRVLPDTTAAWGTFPGAATVMVLMAGDFGADMRLVAFMQYLRVLLVAIVASLVARGFEVGAPHAAVAAAPLAWGALAATVAVAAASAAVGVRLGLPVGAMLGPMIACAALQDVGWLQIELPRALLAPAYAIIGWSIGLRFSRDILGHVARSLPRVFAAIAALIACCGLLAVALVVFAGIDPLTAYLAMSPGGADTVAIIAASSPKVDVPFVMALQVGRFLTILAIGPWLARAIATAAVARAPSAEQEMAADEDRGAGQEHRHQAGSQGH